MANAYNYAIMSANQATPYFFGEAAMNFRYALNQSLSPQAVIRIYDAPSVAQYLAAVGTPQAYPFIAPAQLGVAPSGNLGSLALKLNYGCVIVPSAALNADGGILFTFDGQA